MTEPGSQRGRHRVPEGRRTRMLRLAGVIVAAGAVVAVTGLTVGLRAPAAIPGPASGASTPAPPSWGSAAEAVQGPAAHPVRVRIPAIGVDSPIVDIGVDAAGALVPPPTADRVGWFTAGPAPGDVGPALLAAHVDSRLGPGVFFKLVELHPGDRVTVDRADGTIVSFTVVSTTRVAKAAFPTELVYAPLPVSMLRLITCGGAFDRAARSYRDNVIVEATPVE